MEQQSFFLWVLCLFLMSNAVTGLLVGFFVYKVALVKGRAVIAADSSDRVETGDGEGKGGATAYNIDDLDGAVAGVNEVTEKKNILSDLLQRRNDSFVNQFDDELESLAMNDNEHA